MPTHDLYRNHPHPLQPRTVSMLIRQIQTPSHVLSQLHHSRPNDSDEKEPFCLRRELERELFQ